MSKLVWSYMSYSKTEERFRFYAIGKFTQPCYSIFDFWLLRLSWFQLTYNYYLSPWYIDYWQKPSLTGKINIDLEKLWQFFININVYLHKMEGPQTDSLSGSINSRPFISHYFFSIFRDLSQNVMNTFSVG